MNVVASVEQDGFEALPASSLGVLPAKGKQRMVLIRYPKGMDLQSISGAKIGLSLASEGPKKAGRNRSDSSSSSSSGAAGAAEGQDEGEGQTDAEAEAEVAVLPLQGQEEVVLRLVRGRGAEQQGVNASVRPVLRSASATAAGVVGAAFSGALVLHKRAVRAAVHGPKGSGSPQSVASLLQAAGVGPSYAPVPPVLGLRVPFAPPYGSTTSLDELHRHQQRQEEQRQRASAGASVVGSKRRHPDQEPEVQVQVQEVEGSAAKKHKKEKKDKKSKHDRG